HDSEEDCRVDDGTPEGRTLTSDDLRAEGVEEEAIRLVEIVTKQENPEVPPPGLSKEEVLVWKDEQYFEGIRKIIATGNPSAMRLKLADNRHNGDPARDVHLKPSQLARSARYRERYNRSAQMLEAAIIELGAELPG